MALRPSALGRVKEMSVSPVGGGGDVLHDHVDVDLGVRDRAEDGRGLARLVRHSDDRDLGLGGVVGDSGDDGLLHLLVPLRSSLLTQVPCSPEKDERTWIGML